MCLDYAFPEKPRLWAVTISLHQLAAVKCGQQVRKVLEMTADSLKVSKAKYSSLSSFSDRGEWVKLKFS